MADDEAQSVPDPRTWQQQFDQLRPQPHNAAALQPASPWVAGPPHADPEAPSTIVQPGTGLDAPLIEWTKARFANQPVATGCVRRSF